MSLKYLAFVIAFLLSEIVLRAQTLSPPVLPGEIPAPAPRAEATRHDVFVLGLRVSNEFDDNALSDNNNKQPNLLTVVEPHIGWTVSGSRANWTLDYHPGFSMSRPLSIYDSQSHALDTGVQLALTKRLKVRLRESFLESKNPFDRLGDLELTPGSNVLDRPNSSIVTAARATIEQGGIDLLYTLSSRTIVGVSGAFYQVRYSSQGNALQFGSAKSTGAHGFYSHHLTRRNWVGLDYNIQDLISREPQSRSLVHSVFYTDTLLIRPNMSVSLFLGPELSVTRGQAAFLLSNAESIGAARTNWSWAGGSNYVWSAAHTRLAVGLSRRISDGAGWQGIVRLSTITVELRQQLTRQWAGNLLVSDDHNKALLATSAPPSYVSVAGGLTRSLTRRLSLDVRYWRVHEVATGVQPNAYLADHNRVSTSLVYDFKSPLER